VTKRAEPTKAPFACDSPVRPFAKRDANGPAAFPLCELPAPVAQPAPPPAEPAHLSPRLIGASPVAQSDKENAGRPAAEQCSTTCEAVEAATALLREVLRPLQRAFDVASEGAVSGERALEMAMRLQGLPENLVPRVAPCLAEAVEAGRPLHEALAAILGADSVDRGPPQSPAMAPEPSAASVAPQPESPSTETEPVQQQAAVVEEQEAVEEAGGQAEAEEPAATLPLSREESIDEDGAWQLMAATGPAAGLAAERGPTSRQAPARRAERTLARAEEVADQEAAWRAAAELARRKRAGVPSAAAPAPAPAVPELEETSEAEGVASDQPAKTAVAWDISSVIEADEAPAEEPEVVQEIEEEPVPPRPKKGLVWVV
jgi:hypothetical protein